jgi:RNA polymerase sigma factor (sigma-70 family)
MTPPPAEHFAARIFMGPALRAQPDRRLVDLVRDGYDAAFEEIVRRYRRPLDRFAAAIVGGRSEDVTQDAFSKALAALRGTETEIELRPWLYRIVRNTALNDLRDRPPVAAELTESLPGARSAAAEAEEREEMRDLMARLRALPEPQRAALVMRELEGLSHEEIAAALGVSGGAARQTIFRARAALREGLGLLLPLPVLRTLAEHGGEAGAGGGAIALGGGALKAGMATMLVAGAVGAGVAVEHDHGARGVPGAAAAEPAPRARQSDTSRPARLISPVSSDFVAEDGGEDNRGRDEGRSGDRNESGGSLAEGSGSGHSGTNSGPSGPDRSDSGHGSPGPSADSGSGGGSGSGDRHDDRSGSDDSGSGSSGSGSGSGDDGSGSGSTSGSGSSGSGSGSGDDAGSSGPGSGDVATEPATVEEPALSEDNSGSGSESGSRDSGDDSSSGSSGSGDLSSSGSTGGSDGSP